MFTQPGVQTSEQPDVDPLKLYTPDLADDCRAGSKTCHSRATCHDEEGAGAVEGRGFCCRDPIQ